MRINLLIAFVLLLVFSAVPANAQQKGQYIPGQQGLNAGLLPDPGFTYANLTINYSADTLNNGNGNTVPLTGSYDIWAVANVFYYVPKFKFLDAKFAFMVAPILANGSLTLGSLRFPNLALNAGGEGYSRPLGAARYARLDLEASRRLRWIRVHGAYGPLFGRSIRQCRVGLLGKSFHHR